MIEGVGRTGDGAWNTSRAYGALVARVLPDWLLGFFSAVVVGSILSTFNSVLNSAATLYSLDVYKMYLNPTASSEHGSEIWSIPVWSSLSLRLSRRLLLRSRWGFQLFSRTQRGLFYSLAAVILVGLFNRWADGRSALFTLLWALV